METDTPGTTEPIRFRAGKKRKAFRQRATSDTPDLEGSTSPAPSPAPATAPAQDDEDGESAIQAALKLRNARKSKFRGGVGFSAGGATNDAETSADQQLVLREEDALAAARGIPDRFMHQTGFVVDSDDKHMLEYIESRLASRSGAAASASAHDDARSTAEKHHAEAPRRNLAHGSEQSTSRGKLMEVDIPLDPVAADRKRKADNALAAAAPPRRRRNRRGSEDVKRDQLVERLMHENRLDVYDVPAAKQAAAAAASTAQSQSTDDQLAEDFKRQYMDEVAARRQRRKPAINQHRTGAAAQQAAASEEVLRGPKLGGSRNSRAAIRDILLSQQEQAKRAK